MQRGKGKGRTLSPDDSIIGACDENSILNNLTCDDKFKDGHVWEHVSNAIVEKH